MEQQKNTRTQNPKRSLGQKRRKVECVSLFPVAAHTQSIDLIEFVSEPLGSVRWLCFAVLGNAKKRERCAVRLSRGHGGRGSELAGWLGSEQR